MKVFEELGSIVEKLWRDKNYHDGIFAEIAVKALTEAGLPGRVDPWEIVRWVHTVSQLPRQQDVEGRFGNPPITLFCGSRFYIDLYFWVDGTTEIHQHSFAGAFQVLMGSSIHSRYAFQEEHVINSHLSLGQVTFKNSELLKQGDIRSIQPGRDFIHALFHLDRPSTTITIRTHGAPQAQPQYSYRKPHLAYDPFFREESMIKKLQTVSLLLTTQHPESDAIIGDLLAGSDFQTAFGILDMVFAIDTSNPIKNALRLAGTKDRFRSLLDTARQRHGELVNFIPPVVQEGQRISDLVSRRSSITAKDHRFFLALLLNVPNRTTILELVKQQFTDEDPVDKVLDWVMELSATKVWGSSEPNVLGLKQVDDEHLFVLQCLLNGLSAEDTAAALKREYPNSRPQSIQGRLAEIRESFHGAVVFKSILAD